MVAQYNADPRNNDGGVDHPTIKRSPSPLKRAVATQSPENSLNDDPGEERRSAIETLYDSAAAEVSNGTSILLIQESQEKNFPWSKRLPSSLDTTVKPVPGLIKVMQANIQAH